MKKTFFLVVLMLLAGSAFAEFYSNEDRKHFFPNSVCRAAISARAGTAQYLTAEQIQILVPSGIWRKNYFPNKGKPGMLDSDALFSIEGKSGNFFKVTNYRDCVGFFFTPKGHPAIRSQPLFLIDLAEQSAANNNDYILFGGNLLGGSKTDDSDKSGAKAVGQYGIKEILEFSNGTIGSTLNEHSDGIWNRKMNLSITYAPTNEDSRKFAILLYKMVHYSSGTALNFASEEFSIEKAVLNAPVYNPSEKKVKLSWKRQAKPKLFIAETELGNYKYLITKKYENENETVVYYDKGTELKSEHDEPVALEKKKVVFTLYVMPSHAFDPAANDIVKLLETAKKYSEFSDSKPVDLSVSATTTITPLGKGIVAFRFTNLNNVYAKAKEDGFGYNFDTVASALKVVASDTSIAAGKMEAKNNEKSMVAFSGLEANRDYDLVLELPHYNPLTIIQKFRLTTEDLE